MATQIALLRAVNVGGASSLPMARLRALLTQMGFADPRTLLQSGNAVFESRDLAGTELEARLEAELEKAFGRRIAVRARSAQDWAEVVARNPFPDEASSDPAKLLVMFLQEPPSAATVDALQAAIKGPERVRAHGRQAYIVFPDGVGRSKLTPAVLEKRLGAGSTGRNWNTVLKLAAMAGV
jgi:uncharacterized protein (DUF1697 family)